MEFEGENESLNEEVYKFENEKDTGEGLTSITKGEVKEKPLECELIRAIPKSLKSKSGSTYTQFTLIVRLDKFTEKKVPFVFRRDMHWLNVTPTRISIGCTPSKKNPQYDDWNINALEVQAKLLDKTPNLIKEYSGSPGTSRL